MYVPLEVGSVSWLHLWIMATSTLPPLPPPPCDTGQIGDCGPVSHNESGCSDCYDNRTICTARLQLKRDETSKQRLMVFLRDTPALLMGGRWAINRRTKYVTWQWLNYSWLWSWMDPAAALIEVLGEISVLHINANYRQQQRLRVGWRAQVHQPEVGRKGLWYKSCCNWILPWIPACTNNVTVHHLVL